MGALEFKVQVFARLWVVGCSLFSGHGELSRAPTDDIDSECTERAGSCELMVLS